MWQRNLLPQEDLLEEIDVTWQRLRCQHLPLRGRESQHFRGAVSVRDVGWELDSNAGLGQGGLSGYREIRKFVFSWLNKKVVRACRMSTNGLCKVLSLTRAWKGLEAHRTGPRRRLNAGLRHGWHGGWQCTGGCTGGCAGAGLSLLLRTRTASEPLHCCP